MTHDFPSFEDVIAMHERLIETFGGSLGVRDEGALASALMRPQIGYYDGIVEEAAAMMESLANNHPFMDGNRRVAFFATEAFLRANGYFIDCDDEEAYVFFVGLFETRSFRYAELLEWLEGVVESTYGRG